MPNGGAMRNCALGLCCPPPTQAKALAVMLKRGTKDLGYTLNKEEYLDVARILIDHKLIGTTAEEAETLQQESSPSEQELDQELEA